jgi:hypothetical protein
MMKKSLLLLLAFVAVSFSSCSDDDKPEVLKLHRLTNVACTKNGTAFFSANITYDQTGNISRIITDKYTDNYIYVGNTISVNGVKTDGSNSTGNSFIHSVFTLDGDVISKREEKAENKNANNEVYTSEMNTYNYNRWQLGTVDQIIQWPKTNGQGYEIRNTKDVYTYYWENSNSIRYNYLLKEMMYEYTTQLRPENFPFRVTNTFQPVTFDVLSPLNLLYGSMNRNLAQRAYWYSLNDATNICAEYTFSYLMTSDYITGMTVKEKINPVNGVQAEENTYEYTFVYNSPQ